MDTRDSQEPKLPARLAASRAVPSSVREPSPEPQAAQAVNFRVLLRGITRFWWQILTAWVIGSTVLVTLVYTQVKPEYEASNILRAEPGTQNLFSSAHSADSAYLRPRSS